MHEGGNSLFYHTQASYICSETLSLWNSKHDCCIFSETHLINIPISGVETCSSLTKQTWPITLAAR